LCNFSNKKLIRGVRARVGGGLLKQRAPGAVIRASASNVKNISEKNYKGLRVLG